MNLFYIPAQFPTDIFTGAGTKWISYMLIIMQFVSEEDKESVTVGGKERETIECP